MARDPVDGRRRRQRIAVGSVTSAEWREILEAHEHRCAYCGDDSGPLTKDHVTPLAADGMHDPINIVPACLRCNTVKATLSGPEFRARLRLQVLTFGRQPQPTPFRAQPVYAPLMEHGDVPGHAAAAIVEWAREIAATGILDDLGDEGLVVFDTRHGGSRRTISICADATLLLTSWTAGYDHGQRRWFAGDSQRFATESEVCSGCAKHDICALLSRLGYREV